MLIWNISFGHILQNINMYMFCNFVVFVHWFILLAYKSSFQVFPLARYCDYYLLFISTLVKHLKRPEHNFLCLYLAVTWTYVSLRRADISACRPTN